MKHTPGPWAWEKVSKGRWDVRSDDWGGIVTVHQYPDKNVMPDGLCEANARLIAAAPELLSELIGYHDREWREPHEGIPAHHAGDFPDECGACAAIRKATGGE